MRDAGSAGATASELFPHDVLNESFSHATWTQLSSRALPDRPLACPSPHVRCRDDGSINSVRSSRSLAHSSLTELTASLETFSTGSPRRRRLCSTAVSLCRQPRPSPFAQRRSLRCTLCVAARPGRRLTLALVAVLFQRTSLYRLLVSSLLADYFRCFPSFTCRLLLMLCSQEFAHLVSTVIQHDSIPGYPFILPSALLMESVSARIIPFTLPVSIWGRMLHRRYQGGGRASA